MTRITTEWQQIPTRLPEEGLHSLARRSEDRRRCVPNVRRTIGLVIPPLRQVFWDLANKKKPWPLYLHGPTGHGKTRAVLAFCDHIELARYWSMHELMSSVRYDPPWICWGVRLAVLDELGTVRTGEGHNLDYEIALQFFEWRQDQPTIYISNHPLLQDGPGSPPGIRELYDARIFSRLSSGTVYQLVDRDRRLRA